MMPSIVHKYDTSPDLEQDLVSSNLLSICLNGRADKRRYPIRLRRSSSYETLHCSSNHVMENGLHAPLERAGASFTLAK
ncbi:hypothetical protein Tco_1033988 [Tanacetum coccineum]